MADAEDAGGWVRPRSASIVSTGLQLGDEQTTLCVPMSSTDSVERLRAESGFSRGVRP